MAKNSVIRLDQADVVTRSRIKGVLHQFSCNFMAISWSLAKSCHGGGGTLEGGLHLRIYLPLLSTRGFSPRKEKKEKTVSILVRRWKMALNLLAIGFLLWKKKKKKGTFAVNFRVFPSMRRRFWLGGRGFVEWIVNKNESLQFFFFYSRAVHLILVIAGLENRRRNHRPKS